MSFLERSPYPVDGGQMIGRDPRQMAREEWGVGFGGPILAVIRAKCLDCCCNQQYEVRKCTTVNCPLWPYRMGTNPFTNRRGNASGFKRPRA
jgi:hypothetical protein